MPPAGKTAHRRTHSALETRPPEPGTSPRAGGIFVSWLGFAFGSVTSVAANVLHTWLPASSQPRRTWFWNAVRYGIGTIVAVGSFAISYGHIHAVLIAWYYEPIAAAIGPLVLDGRLRDKSGIESGRATVTIVAR